jgi:hypothetical protein
MPLETMCVLQLDIHQLSNMVKSHSAEVTPFVLFSKLMDLQELMRLVLVQVANEEKIFHTAMTELPLTYRDPLSTDFQLEFAASLFRSQNEIVLIALPDMKLSYRGFN